MIRSLVIKVAALGAAVAATSTAALAQGLLTAYFPIPMALMAEAAKTAITVCAAKGEHVAAAIYDSNAVERVLFVGDHTVDRHHVIELARRKAYTSLNDGGQLSSEMMKRWEADPAGVAGYMGNGPTTGLRNITVAGGAPIKINKDAIAGLGVAGSSTPEQDEACAVAGVAKIQDRLNRLQNLIDPLKAK